jgi:Na+/phosphate symporter
MKNKIFWIIIIAVILLFWNENTIVPNLYIKIIGIGILFYGMMRLSAKIPSKKDKNNE